MTSVGASISSEHALELNKAALITDAIQVVSRLPLDAPRELARHKISASPYVGEALIIRVRGAQGDERRRRRQSLLAGGVGSVMAVRRTVGERRRCCDGTESDKDKNCFHEHSPDLRWPSWLTTEAMTAVHGLFFPGGGATRTGSNS
jgi:hypothetical protein